jgi:hypothetical protein
MFFGKLKNLNRSKNNARRSGDAAPGMAKLQSVSLPVFKHPGEAVGICAVYGYR